MKEAKMTEKELDCLTIPGFSKDGNWYKGNLHSHTIHSDGHLTPEEAVNIYRKHGYHFLCFSEHDLYTDYRSQFDCEDFIILPGMEASAVLFESKSSPFGKRYTISMGFSVRKRCRSKRLSRYTTIWKATLSENIMESGTVQV